MIPVNVGGVDQDGSETEATLYNPKSEGREGSVGQMVFTRSADEPFPTLLPFINATYGNAINQDGAASGTPINVHNGTDNAYWTGSNVVGSKVTFDSTDTGTGWPPAGTKSVKIDNPALNDVWQFAKGSNQDLTGYNSISMKIYIDKDWTSGDSINIFGTIGGVLVGNAVLVEDYIDEFLFDTVQTLSISLADMGLTGQTIDAFRMSQVGRHGKAALWYLDTFDIQENGIGIEFKTFHDSDDIYIAKSLVVTLGDALSATLTNGAGITPLSPIKILGLTQLTSGLLIMIVSGGVTKFSGSITNLGDLQSIGFVTTNKWSDGTNTQVTLELEFSEPLVMRRSNTLDYVSVTVSDDLTGLTRFNATLRGSVIPKL